MQQRLQEFVDSQGQSLRVDAERGVLRGVKLLGFTSRNGRTYRETALAEAAALYEGAKVNVNHAKAGPLAPRDYQDRLGAIRGVQFKPGEGLFGDLHYNPKHALAEQLAWDAQHAPEQVGLSHNVLAQTTREGEGTVVDAITKVESVDLVADPATTRGLFEHDAGHQMQLSEQLDAARGEIARLERRLVIFELLAEHGLPLPGTPNAERAVSGEFLDVLATAGDESAVRALVADRAALVREAGASQVESREQRWLDDERSQSPATAEEFAAAVRR